MEETNNDVLNFIKRFHDYNDNVTDVFTNGCCYYFARDLAFRFFRTEAEIMYDPVACHFGTKVDGRVYDITGDVTDSYRWEPWKDFDDVLEKARIILDCILF